MKKKIAIIIVTLLVAVIVVGMIPFPCNITINETAIEYSRSDIEIAVPHEVHIEGTYYTKLFGKDRFEGAFYISDVKNLDAETQVDFEFHPRFRYYPKFYSPMPFLRITGIGVIFFERNFETLAFQLAYEFKEDQNGTSMSNRDDRSNFIVVGAKSREEALNIYQKLLERE